MYINITLNKKTFTFHLFLSLFLSLLFFQKSEAQCAGVDASIEICNITDASSTAVDLFALLGPNALAGGKWVDNDFSGGLNTANGILNVQKINESGTFTYSYFVNNIVGCLKNVSTVKVTVGGYAGVPLPDGSACGSPGEYNLFRLFNASGENLRPQSNGNWFNITTDTPINGNIIGTINPPTDVPITQEYSYTMPAIGNCPETSVRVFLSFFRTPSSGIAIPLDLCDNTDDFSLYTNVDLFSLINGEDAGGRWTEFGTNQITSPADTTIDIQQMYADFGPGIYNFSYTVLPTNAICEESITIVTIRIEKIIDYTNTVLTVDADVCQENVSSSSFTAKLVQDPPTIPDGGYSLKYSVNGNVFPLPVAVSFSNGIATSFDIPRLYFPSSSNYTVKIESIVADNTLNICKNILPIIEDKLFVFPTPSLSSAKLEIPATCIDTNVIATLTDMQNLDNGSYTITYSLPFPNDVTPQTAIIEIVDGVSSFVISSSIFKEIGNTTLTITNIVNNLTGCKGPANVKDIFDILPLPDISKLDVQIRSICVGNDIVVQISGLEILKKIFIQYDISGSNTSLNNEQTLDLINGKASFKIPLNLLANTGETTFTLTKIRNEENGCDIEVGKQVLFKINDLPVAPVALTQEFCELDNATIAVLKPNEPGIKWYDSLDATTSLPPATLLRTLEYYVTQTDLLTGCESLRTKVSVIINIVPDITVNPSLGEFCGADKPTIRDLSNKTNVPNTVIWFDAPKDGNKLSPNYLLVEGEVYYGIDKSPVTGCISKNILEVVATLTVCKEEPVSFFIPEGFSPNNDGVNDTFSIPNIDFVYPKYTLEIYNRYGNLLFSGNKNKPTWDGSDSNSNNAARSIVPNGVYFYVINYNKGDKSPKQGRLYLNR
jgi:gliding motility-associated-like protein